MLTTRLWQRFVKSLGNLRLVRRPLARTRKGYGPRALTEVLESRQMLSMTVSLSGSSVTFAGDGANDSLTLTVGGTGLLTHNLPLGGDLVSAVDLDSATAGEQTLAFNSLSSLTVNAGGGNDLVDASALSKAVSLNGGDGNDTLIGGSANDEIEGNAGDDWIEGNGGNDLLRGDNYWDGNIAGNDTLWGGAGNDTIHGDSQYYGGTGNDVLDGGDGNDNLNAHGGNNLLYVRNATFSNAVAGTGYDKLIFLGSNIHLDLVAANKVSGAEEIDISGGGNNSLTINQARVISLSDTTDTLIVRGNVGDIVNKGTGWAFAGTETISSSLFKTYTQGAATLKLQQATDVSLRQFQDPFNYLLDAANPAGFTGSFSVVGVQSYQGLGPTGNQFNSKFLQSSGSATLTLTDLPAHDRLDLGFLLAIIDSWDGGTNDYFNVRVDGTTIFRESFSYEGLAQQSYVPPQGGLISSGTQLGFSSWNDAAYNMFLEPKLQSISHTASTLTIEWLANGPGWQGGTDESWAIDNLQITLSKAGATIPYDLGVGSYVANFHPQDIEPFRMFT